MKIIAISGRAGSGKDTAAQMIKRELELRRERVLVTHYADLLKYICKTFLGWDGEKDEAGRTLLQTVGTDIIRSKNPDFWVGFIMFILECFPEKWDYVLIPDTRFPNEIDNLRRDGFDVTHIRVTRREPPALSLSETQKIHPSETAMYGVKPDIPVSNNGTLEELSDKIQKIVKESFYAV